MKSTHATPSRLRSFEDCQIETHVILKMILGRGFAPSRQEYTALEKGLSIGDQAMDTFVEAGFRSACPGQHWKEFQQTLITGNTTDLPELKNLLLMAQTPPFTPDWEQAKRGALFIHRTGTLATDVLRDMALMGGYLMAAFNQTLVMTGDLEKGAASRLANTSHWWLRVTQPDANQAGKSGFEATLRVRWIHAMVRRHLKNHPQWNASIFGLPINQIDMAATYLGFSFVMLLGLRKSGVYVSKENSCAVMHLWKIIAWQMGVDEQWLVDTEAQAAVKLRQYVMTHTRPDETTYKLAKALADEPLTRNYRNLSMVRRRMAWLSHMSSSAWLLGPSTLKKLGLSSPLGPWLKPVELAPQAAWFYLHSVHYRLEKRQSINGRNAQIKAVSEIHFDQKEVKKSTHPATPVS